MSEHYHDVSDLRLLKDMGKLAPTEFNAWLNLDKIVGREDGAIPRKYRELIALGDTLDQNFVGGGFASRCLPRRGGRSRTGEVHIHRNPL